MTARDAIGASAAAAFEITVDGDVVQAYPDDSLAAAMIRAGRTSWRTTRFAAAPRGLFCGIGACYDCLVTVNGVVSVRACLDPARPGDVVTSQEGAGRADLGS